MGADALEVCVFVPSAPSPVIPMALQGQALPLVALSGDAPPDLPNPQVDVSNVDVRVQSSLCDPPVNQSEQVFESQQASQAAACVFWDEE